MNKSLFFSLKVTFKIQLPQKHKTQKPSVWRSMTILQPVHTFLNEVQTQDTDYDHIIPDSTLRKAQ